MTRKEFLTLPIELRRAILQRQAEELQPEPGTLCKECLNFEGCEMRDASRYCGDFEKK